MENGRVIPVSLGMVKVFVIKGEKSILVDAGLPGSTNSILNGLKKNNIEPGDISLIVVTHNHTDHTGGLHALKELTGAKVVVHKSEAAALEQGKSTEVNPIGPIGRIAVKLFRRPVYKGVKADITVEDELDLKGFGVDGKVIHTPGHTPGSISLILSSGEAVVGDLLSGKNTKKGYTASMPFFACDLGELEGSLNKVAGLSPKVIYNSHGAAVDVQAVKGLITKLKEKFA